MAPAIYFPTMPDTSKVALIALCGVAVSAFVAWATALRGQYVNAVTVERSRWINALRENIATFSGVLRTLNFRSETNTLDHNTKVETVSEINRLISLINLQLNPHGTIEKNIAMILERMPALAEKNDGTALRSRDKLLIRHCQWLLKAEWERVKYEARWLSRPWLWVKRQWYLVRYRRFSSREGRIL